MLNTMCAVALTATLGQGFYGGGGGLSDQMLPYDTQDPQHHGYYQRMPAYGGFNSFRPYNYKHALSQAQAAGGWGLPPVMPYSQQFWNRYKFRASGVQPNLPNFSHQNFHNVGPQQSGYQQYGASPYGVSPYGQPSSQPYYGGNPSPYPQNTRRQPYYGQPPASTAGYSPYPGNTIPASGNYYPPAQPTIDPALYEHLQMLEEQRVRLQQQIEAMKRQQSSQPPAYPGYSPYPYPTPQYPGRQPYPAPAPTLYGP